MKILIVEDEPLAAVQLAAFIAEIIPEAKILAVCDTIEGTLKWLSENEMPDLAFFDVQLGDGICFEIFKRVELQIPVIFTTAYDQYAIQAFKVNSIDYLLKPIDKAELTTATQKFNLLHGTTSTHITPQLIQNLISSIGKPEYKKRFLVKIGTHLRAIDTDDIDYFYSYQKGTFLKSNDGRNYLLDQTLETIEQLVDPSNFFRIDRKYLVALNSIIDVISYSNSRFKLKVKNQEEDDFLVAREKAKQFKEWLEGKN
jgi:DNA-binding LytR/AlgR family response regulator